MAKEWQTVRVFISSTFRDMKEEREELVKRVFPQLRYLCEQRGVTWGEVDLRWGVPDEQKAEGKVLPICLAEIENCRPYFIGLLGERYGWLPEKIPPDLIAQQKWLEEHKGKSVTELEILHGVLNNPQMANRAGRNRSPARQARLRHTFACNCVKAGVSTASLKKLLGHDRLETTEIYLNISPEDALSEFRRKVV